MKKYYKNVLFFLMAISFLVGCRKLDDNYLQFIDDGEIIYIGKADSILIRGGNHRVEVSWLLLSDPKVHSYKLYWNNHNDSISGEVVKTSQVDTVRVLLNEMSEGLHHFEILMFDEFGNRSVPMTASGRVYGDQYNNFLVNRTYNAVQIIDEENLEIDWMPAEDQLLYSEITYSNSDGNTIKHVVDREAELDTLKKFPLDGTFSVLSAFKPDSLALDTFYSEAEEITPFEID